MVQDPSKGAARPVGQRRQKSLPTKRLLRREPPCVARWILDASAPVRITRVLPGCLHGNATGGERLLIDRINIPYVHMQPSWECWVIGTSLRQHHHGIIDPHLRMHDSAVRCIEPAELPCP